MLLKHRSDQILVEVLDLPELWNPFASSVLARLHEGEEMQDPELFGKVDLVFPSGEPLPQCWLDPHYRDQEIFANHPSKVLTG